MDKTEFQSKVEAACQLHPGAREARGAPAGRLRLDCYEIHAGGVLIARELTRERAWHEASFEQTMMQRFGDNGAFSGGKW